jgi:conjugal transfer pilus assembly protein TraD
MLLSDIAACAAARYNFGTEEDKKKKVYLIVDETAQVANDPYIQILNMAGGSGFVNVASTQTIPDFAARLGDENKARVMLGNFNNLIALRTKDRVTQDFIVETFGESYVYTMQRSHGTNSSTEKNIAHFSGTIQEKKTDALENKFPPDLLGVMPNWQYIGSVSGGKIIKGRLDILVGE